MSAVDLLTGGSDEQRRRRRGVPGLSSGEPATHAPQDTAEKGNGGAPARSAPPTGPVNTFPEADDQPLPPHLEGVRDAMQARNAPDLAGFYQSTLGRAPDANEIETDTANIAKYGWDAFTRDFQRRVAPTSHRAFDSQGPAFDQITNQPLVNAISQSQAGTAPALPPPAPGAGRQSFDLTAPPSQFDDPYTNLLERIASQQLKALEQPQTNPQLDRLLNHLHQQFDTLATSPGFSPEELAVLRTQALEPIERDRAAGTQRIAERTAARNMLPSSGLHELDLRDVDRDAEQRRAAVQRDLGIAAIDRRRADRNQALQVGQLAGIQIPQIQRDEDTRRRNEALSIASLLYDLPGRALAENMSVINGTPGPETLFGQSVQLMQANQQARQANAQMWAQLFANGLGAFDDDDD